MIFELIISLIVFLGLFVGLFISRNTREELVPGIIYFTNARKFLFSFIIGFVMYDYGHLWLGLTFFVLLSVVSYFSKQDFSKWMYLLLSLAAFMAISLNLLVVPILIFLYGFFEAAMFLSNQKKEKLFCTDSLNLFKKKFLFLLILIVLILAKYFYFYFY